MSTATWGTTVGTIFGAVTTTAAAASSLIGTAAATVSLLDNYVGSHVKQQQISMDLESDDFEEKIIERLSVERTNRQLELVKFTNQSEVHKQLFENNVAALRARAAARRAPVSA